MTTKIKELIEFSKDQYRKHRHIKAISNCPEEKLYFDNMQSLIKIALETLKAHEQEFVLVPSELQEYNKKHLDVRTWFQKFRVKDEKDFQNLYSSIIRSRPITPLDEILKELR